MKIIYSSQSLPWHFKWMNMQIAAFRLDRMIANMDYLDPDDRPIAMQFVNYLRDKGYDAWRYIPLEGKSYIYVNLTENEYVFEQLRLE